MIKVKEDGKLLVIDFNGFEIVKHSNEIPFLHVGSGTANYDMLNGNFEIEEHLNEKIALTDYTVLEEKATSVKVKFSRNEVYAVTVNFTEVDGRLHIDFQEKPKGLNRSWIKIAAQENEHIYGCGEQFSELDLKGKKVPLWVSEQGVGRNKKDYLTFQADVHAGAGGDWYTTYYPQPTFVSSKNYWCHVEDSHYMEFDFRNDLYHELCVWSIPSKVIISKKNTALEVLEDLTAYLGRQPELPDWSYDGVWLGLQGGTETVLKKLENAQNHGLKVVALWCQDWEGKRITDFGKRLFWNWEYHKEMYPDLPQTIKELNEKGIKFLGYINTFLATDGEMYKEATKKGYIVKDNEGKDYEGAKDMPAVLMDFTNPEAVNWIKNIIKENMIGIGLSGWMCDFGEYLPTDAVLYSGESAESYHNKYPAEWAKINREAVEEAGKLGEVVFFTRAGYTGTSRYSLLMWAGDQTVNWSLDDGLASVIPAALSLGMSGFGISHSDIGGYTSLYGVKRTKELFMRWAEMAAFTPVMRTHEGNRPDDCWQFDSDEETLLHFAKMSKIYTHLKPYIKDVVKENAEKGIPAQRHPYIHYENDEELHKLKYQYLFGRDLMVAPVYEENKTSRKLYLPEDNWIHVWTGKEYGKGYHEVEAPLGEIPVFYRKGSQYEDLFKQIADIK
ncbi:MAG: sulfoquinovosidase [Clostridia bacterium]|jgi:alpha-glucosidase|nr:family 31 glycosyl hydrolase, alpha-glucosidase [Clostridiales bacterium]MDK2985797.1 sulfoquinovosidase [Clostridia bacterium]